MQGWSIYDNPNLVFRNIVGKLKNPTKSNSNIESNENFLVGNDILSIEQGKLQKKTPFDKNILTHFQTQENIFDHIFTNLSKIYKKIFIVILFIIYQKLPIVV